MQLLYSHTPPGRQEKANNSQSSRVSDTIKDCANKHGLRNSCRRATANGFRRREKLLRSFLFGYGIIICLPIIGGAGADDLIFQVRIFCHRLI
jgi:hypothetical protein